MLVTLYFTGVLFNFVGIFVMIGRLKNNLPSDVYRSLILRSFILVYLMGMACMFADTESLDAFIEEHKRDINEQ